MVMPRELLTNDDLEQALHGLEWSREGDKIAKTVTLADFAAAMSFVNRVADLAEALDHHPDISISWNKVTLEVTSHDAGGLTAADIELAKAVDAMPSP